MPSITSVRVLLIACWVTSITALSNTDIFANPIITRVYNGNQYALANSDRKTGDRVDIATVASSLAALKPSYVNSFIYVNLGDNLTANMINDFNTVHTAVRAQSPNAKFDIEISLNKTKVPSADALVAFMGHLNTQLTLDGWWFDEWSSAQANNPDWVVAATAFAHNHSQLVGGNVFDKVVPPDSDAIAFVDNPSNDTEWGFGFNDVEIAKLKANTSSAIIMGHLQNNPQNGQTTESCVYMDDWNSTRRADYQYYWISQQAKLGYKYMIPVFFPECPGAYAFNPLTDVLNATVPGYSGGSDSTLYDYLKSFAPLNSTTGTSTSTLTGSATTSASASSTATKSAGGRVSVDGAWAACIVAAIGMLGT